MEQIELRTHNGLVWIQIIDAKGISRYRSWTKRVGDSLKDVRYDVRQMLSSGDIQEGISVGRFSMTFKSMVPIFDNDQSLMGLVEVISHMDPLAKRLSDTMDVQSVILVDQRFKSQLTRADSERFLGEFYIANQSAEEEDLVLLEGLGQENFTRVTPHQEQSGQLITQYLIEDSLGRLMGYWFTFTDESNVDFTEV